MGKRKEVGEDGESTSEVWVKKVKRGGGGPARKEVNKRGGDRTIEQMKGEDGGGEQRRKAKQNPKQKEITNYFPKAPQLN